VGEQRSVLLKDGTRVTLNTGSRIEVRLKPGRRKVRLVQGEALFEVAHDAAAPFKVEAGGAELTDVGTQFNLDMRADRIDVRVTEGRVAVGARGSETVLLSANDRMAVASTGLGPVQHGVNMTSTLAWTQRRLMFDRRPLFEVAEEFNRYNREPIHI